MDKCTITALADKTHHQGGQDLSVPWVDGCGLIASGLPFGSQDQISVVGYSLPAGVATPRVPFRSKIRSQAKHSVEFRCTRNHQGQIDGGHRKHFVCLRAETPVRLRDGKGSWYRTRKLGVPAHWPQHCQRATAAGLGKVHDRDTRGSGRLGLHLCDDGSPPFQR